jgi:hypothetical protein
MRHAMSHIVYCHEINGKKYVGVTGKGLLVRLRQHVQLANAGSETFFHRAIRKYGVANIVSTVLFESVSREEALEKEKDYILMFRSNDELYGYNLTSGGDGGDCVSMLEGDKRASWIKKLSIRSTGKRNANHSGFTDRELIHAAVKFYIVYGSLGRNEWFSFSKKNGYPQSFSKNRFGGSFKNFTSLVKVELSRLGFEYSDSDFNMSQRSYSPESRKKISDAISGRRFYNDGTRNYQIYENDERIQSLNLQKGVLKRC